MDKENLALQTSKTIEDLKISENKCIDLLKDIRILEEKNTEIELDILKEISNDTTLTNQLKRDITKAQYLKNDLHYLNNKENIQSKTYELEKEQVNSNYLKRIIRLNTAYLQNV